jgi:hypothetical protein
MSLGSAEFHDAAVTGLVSDEVAVPVPYER